MSVKFASIAFESTAATTFGASQAINFNTILTDTDNILVKKSGSSSIIYSNSITKPVLSTRYYNVDSVESSDAFGTFQLVPGDYKLTIKWCTRQGQDSKAKFSLSTRNKRGNNPSGGLIGNVFNDEGYERTTYTVEGTIRSNRGNNVGTEQASIFVSSQPGFMSPTSFITGLGSVYRVNIFHGYTTNSVPILISGVTRRYVQLDIVQLSPFNTLAQNEF